MARYNGAGYSGTYSGIPRDTVGYSGSIQRYSGIWEIQRDTAEYSGVKLVTAGYSGIQRDTAGYSKNILQSTDLETRPSHARTKRRRKSAATAAWGAVVHSPHASSLSPSTSLPILIRPAFSGVYSHGTFFMVGRSGPFFLLFKS